MGKNTSIALGDHFENFIDEKISEGRFKNASELIRAGLRLLEDEEQKINLLRSALKDGENGKRVEGFDFESHLATLHKKHLR